MFYLSALTGLTAYLVARKKGLFSRPTACSGAFFLSVDQKNWNKIRFFRANTSNIHNFMYNSRVLLIQDTLLIWNYWIASPRLLWPASSKKAGFLFSGLQKPITLPIEQPFSQFFFLMPPRSVTVTARPSKMDKKKQRLCSAFQKFRIFLQLILVRH